MSSYKSNFLDNKYLNFMMNHAAYTPPTTLYVALFTVQPTAAGTGGTEVSGGSYARVAVTANTTNFPTTSTQSITNGTTIGFVTPTAAWGVVVAAALMDAPSGGNMLYIGALTSSFAIGSGAQVQFVPASLVVTEA